MRLVITKSDSDLQHHGILGQKWGVRRYQNKDGSLTAAGRSRYHEKVKEYKNEYDKASRMNDEADEAWLDVKNQYRNLGKNGLQRITAVVLNNTQAAKNTEKIMIRL